MKQPVEIDGSEGEGGGQILRSALALAMVTGRTLQLHSIRAKRERPGLMRQHLACVHAAQAVCNAQVSGAELGAQSLNFQPGAVRAGHYRFVVSTAGSATLVLQTVLPALMLADAPSQLQLAGGTHNPMAPPFHFIERAWAPLLRRMGLGLTLELRRHGFYPAGGGEFLAQIEPAPNGPHPFDLLERGPATQAFAEALSAGVPRHVAFRELSVLQEALGWAQADLRTPPMRQEEGPGNALMATLVHEQLCELFTCFGQKNLRAEHVAQQLLRDVCAWQASSAALGPHLADQLALPLALAVWRQGRPARYSCTEATAHLRSNLAVIEAFLPVRTQVRRRLGTAAGWEVSLVPPPGL
jgi:RNA 3'-terminal phosphate cyclase (ATP)